MAIFQVPYSFRSLKTEDIILSQYNVGNEWRVLNLNSTVSFTFYRLSHHLENVVDTQCMVIEYNKILHTCIQYAVIKFR